MCMQQPAGKNGNGKEAGNGKLKTERAFWEPTPGRKLQHLADLAKNKLWMEIVFYARDKPDVVASAVAHLLKARKEIITYREMERECCKDADRILAFIAEECPFPEIGKRAVSDIVLMGDAGGERVFKGVLLSGIATRARNCHVAAYALEQMMALGMRLEIRGVAEDFVGMSDMRTRVYAKELLARMNASDLESSGHGC